MRVNPPLIAASARKHDVSDDDMTHAFDHPMFVEDLDEGFTMFVGPGRAGRLLEVGVVDSEDGPVIVHAMPARAKYVR